MVPDPDAPLREQILNIAASILAQDGPDALSLREVARRAGVSHQAPYKHFASKEAIVAELVARAFERFATFLRQAAACGPDPMPAMGTAYVHFARSHPFEYRLMFGGPLPDPTAHPRVLAQARAAFDLLREGLAAERGAPAGDPEVARDALFVWASLHGLATILESEAVTRLDLVADEDPALLAHVLGRLGRAMR
jgi:AcrR family transcriptional regulator